MIEQDLVAYLSSQLSIGARVHPGLLPDEPVLPALVYLRVSTIRDVAHDGPVEPVRSRFQFDAWALTYGAARELAGELTQALVGYSGTMGGSLVAIPRQDADRDLPDEETGYYRVMSEFIIWHDE